MGAIDLAGRHPRTQGKMRFFAWEHLREDLQPVAKLFADLAWGLLVLLPDDSELTMALDKLREAKDRAVSLAAVTYQQHTEV